MRFEATPLDEVGTPEPREVSARSSGVFAFKRLYLQALQLQAQSRPAPLPPVLLDALLDPYAHEIAVRAIEQLHERLTRFTRGPTQRERHGR